VCENKEAKASQGGTTENVRLRRIRRGESANTLSSVQAGLKKICISKMPNDFVFMFEGKHRVVKTLNDKGPGKTDKPVPCLNYYR